MLENLYEHAIENRYSVPLFYFSYLVHPMKPNKTLLQLKREKAFLHRA